MLQLTLFFVIEVSQKKHVFEGLESLEMPVADKLIWNQTDQKS